MRILDAEKKFKTDSNGKITTRKEYMPILYTLSDKIAQIMENYSSMREYIKGREEEWNKLRRDLRVQRHKLKVSEIIADRTAPRGKVVVEDEEGFPTAVPTIYPKPQSRAKSILELTDEDLIDKGINLDDTDTETTTAPMSLDDLLNSDDLTGEDGKNVMSAIDDILNGTYDSIVLDKSKLQGLTLDDILDIK